MYCKKAILTLLAASAVHGADFSGARALEYARKCVSFGPRPPGSAAIRQLQAHILAELKQRGCRVLPGDFTARTPGGPMQMKNIIAHFPGKSGRIVAITGHYDTKLFREFRFVGANDGGSSAGFLLEMARVLQTEPHADDIYLVWFDGEEALREWSASDSLYGSRELARRWSADGTAARIKALINVDMIGDKDLEITRESYSTPWLQQLVWNTARRLGYGKYFSPDGGPVEDDHAPFLQARVPALDLIDFNYGPGNSWWHTAQDTPDKLSAHSFEVVGTVLTAALRDLEAR